jgi:hypothetical protein
VLTVLIEMMNQLDSRCQPGPISLPRSAGSLFGWSQERFSLVSIQHQSPAICQPTVFFSHNKSAPAASHPPAIVDTDFNYCIE